MTAPINFPGISAPQLAPPKRSQLDGFAEFLNALNVQREERAARREQLDMQRRALDSNLETDKLSRKKTERELEIADLRMNAEDVADRYAREATTTPNIDEAGVSAIMGRMLSTEDKKLAPYLTEAFMRQVKGHQEVLASIAQRQSAQSAARVDQATEADKIKQSETASKRAELELQRAGVELQTAKVQQHLAEVEQTYGAARGSIAGAVLQGGGTLGQAYRIIGVPVPPGVDPNFTVVKAGSGAATEQQRKLEGTAGMVTLGNSWIEAAGDPEISKMGAIIRRGGTVGGLLEILGSSKLSEAERSAIAGYRMLGEGFALYVTGQQASAAQVDRLVGVISKQPGEVGKAAETRSLLRQAVVNLIQNAAAGGSPAQGMDEIVKLARARGADDRTIATLKAFALDAKKYETTSRAKNTAAAPADAIVDPVVARRLATPPPRR